MKLTENYKINKIALGCKFKELRERQSLTQEEVAKHFGWQKQVVSDLENGKAVSLEKFLLLADLFLVSLDGLKDTALCK